MRFNSIQFSGDWLQPPPQRAATPGREKIFSEHLGRTYECILSWNSSLFLSYFYVLIWNWKLYNSFDPLSHYHITKCFRTWVAMFSVTKNWQHIAPDTKMLWARVWYGFVLTMVGTQFLSVFCPCYGWLCRHKNTLLLSFWTMIMLAPCVGKPRKQSWNFLAKCYTLPVWQQHPEVKQYEQHSFI